MSELSEMLADGNNPDMNEATAYPYWLIIDPAKVPLSNYQLRTHYISSAITGPFFSRSAAEDRLKYASHHYSKHAIVFCASGHASDDWVKLMKLAKREGVPVVPTILEKVEAKQAAYSDAVDRGDVAEIRRLAPRGKTYGEVVKPRSRIETQRIVDLVNKAREESNGTT